MQWRSHAVETGLGVGPWLRVSAGVRGTVEKDARTELRVRLRAGVGSGPEAFGPEGVNVGRHIWRTPRGGPKLRPRGLPTTSVAWYSQVGVASVCTAGATKSNGLTHLEPKTLV